MTFCSQVERFKIYPQRLDASLKLMSNSVPTSKYSEVDASSSIWDMFAVRVPNESQMRTTARLIQAFGKHEHTKLSKLRKYAITECMFISFKMVFQMKKPSTNGEKSNGPLQ